MKSLHQLLKETIDVTDNPNFWIWFGDSKVVDDNNKPLVVYHGTDQTFNVFRNRSGVYFFATDEEYALTGNHSAGPDRHVMKVYLRLVYPKIVDSTNTTGSLTSRQIEQFKKQGFDGLIGKIGEHVFEYIVFSPYQIKSINNNGNFDPNDPDITH